MSNLIERLKWTEADQIRGSQWSKLLNEIIAEAEALTVQRDAALAVCQRLQEHFDGPVDLETIRDIAADAVKVLVAVESTKSALPRPIESPTCTSMFNPEKGGE